MAGLHTSRLKPLFVPNLSHAISSISRAYIYIGITDNPERRINQHNKGYNRTTKPYRPFQIITIEQFPNRIEARKREKYLKSGVGRGFLRNIRVGDRAGLSTDR
jgi:putative endonuclease